MKALSTRMKGSILHLIAGILFIVYTFQSLYYLCGFGIFMGNSTIISFLFIAIGAAVIFNYFKPQNYLLQIISIVAPAIYLCELFPAIIYLSWYAWIEAIGLILMLTITVSVLIKKIRLSKFGNIASKLFFIPIIFWLSAFFLKLIALISYNGFHDSWIFLISDFALPCALSLILIAVLIDTGIFVKKESEENKEKHSYGKGYCNLAKHILLLIFTVNIWNYIWTYKTTKYLNQVKDEEYRSPTKKLLLCIFVPFYYIYWTYKSAGRCDKLAKDAGVNSDIGAICLILAIFFPLIPPIIIQEKINSVIKAKKSGNIPEHKETNISNESTEKEQEFDSKIYQLQKYKQLLNEGIISEEEFNEKKKQLLNL